MTKIRHDLLLLNFWLGLRWQNWTEIPLLAV